MSSVHLETIFEFVKLNSLQKLFTVLFPKKQHVLLWPHKYAHKAENTQNLTHSAGDHTDSCVKHQKISGWGEPVVLSCIIFEVLEPGAASHNLWGVVFHCTALHISMTINKHQLSYFPKDTSHGCLVQLTAGCSATRFP